MSDLTDLHDHEHTPTKKNNKQSLKRARKQTNNCAQHICKQDVKCKTKTAPSDDLSSLDFYDHTMNKYLLLYKWRD